MAHILVAEDEVGLRAFLVEALETDGHDVVGVGDGDAAARLLDEREFEVLVTDLKMPGRDGLALLQKARAEQPELEVIVLTAHGGVETAVEAMKKGAFDFIQKPLSGPDALRLLVTRAIERRALRMEREVLTRDRKVSSGLSWGAPAMRPVLEAVRKVAQTHASVLLTGESGTGKDVTARMIHQLSTRRDRPFVAVNCAMLSESLLESELFGHEKGAFTGAHAQRRGRLELCDGGTFFLDEVGELRPTLQARLLRVLQERSFERVGGTRTLRVDIRWIAATNRDLRRMIEEGSFREDLYHRLSVFPIRLPPLRDRPEDVGPLCQVLLEEIAPELGRPRLELTRAALTALEEATFPGNVRELRNTLERAAILAEGAPIDVEHLFIDPLADEPNDASASRDAPTTLADLERQAIEDALRRCHGNRRKAAESLGIGLRTLYEKLKRFELG